MLWLKQPTCVVTFMLVSFCDNDNFIMQLNVVVSYIKTYMLTLCDLFIGMLYALEMGEVLR